MQSDILSFAAIIISVLALCVSVFIGFRQLRLARQANHVPVLLALLSELRSYQFHKNYNLVMSLNEKEYPSSCGIFGLPETMQTAVLDVAYHYQAIANLVELGILDEEPVLQMTRMRVFYTWKSVKPYVETERKRSSHYVQTEGEKSSKSSHQQMLSILEQFADKANPERSIESGESRLG
jgi:Domain of unknown function (DUF4760)